MEPGSMWQRSKRGSKLGPMPGSMRESMKRESKRGSIGRVAAVAMAALLVVVGPACSKDSKDDSSSTTLDVNVDPPNDPATTTAPSSSDTTVADTEPVPSTTTEVVSGESFGGAIDGQDGGIDIAFTKADGVIRNFAVRDLEIECLPLAGGEATTATIDVVLDPVPVGADGMVDYTDEDADFAPQLSGSFADDGRFIGGLYLSQEQAGSVCGGEFTFELGS